MKQVKLIDRTFENDIKFKGVFSYRHLSILAWTLLVLAQLLTLLVIAKRFYPEININGEAAEIASAVIGSLPLPLLLISKFSKIINNEGQWKKTILKSFLIALALFIVDNFVAIHFGYQLVNIGEQKHSWWDSLFLISSYLIDLKVNILLLNIFIDMFLYWLIYFFLMFKPKNASKNKTLVFRFLVTLPILYEIGGIVVKFLICSINLQLPCFVLFMLPSKSPLISLAVIALFFCLKVFRTRYLKRFENKQIDVEARYKDYMQTNAYCLKISILITTVFFIEWILDSAVLIGIFFKFFNEAIALPLPQEGIIEYITNYINLWFGWGFGTSITMIFALPIIFFFCIKKKCKNPGADILVPICGIGIIVVLYAVGLFDIFINLIKV